MFCDVTTHSFPAEIFDASPLSDDDQRIGLEQIELLHLCPRWAACFHIVASPAGSPCVCSPRPWSWAPRTRHTLLRELRWLPIQKRIDMRLGTIAFLCRTGCAPTYLSEELNEVTSIPGRRRLRCSFLASVEPPSTLSDFCHQRLCF